MTLAEARPQEDPPTVTADETTAPVEAEEYEEYDDEPEVTDTRMGRGFGVIAVAALIVALASAVTAGAGAACWGAACCAGAAAWGAAAAGAACPCTAQPALAAPS